ncbi:hypothetical protein KM043_009478 [Ampulex compressa]|nr:hypothetical protein KM043_009478 [Ampulex compressa]
MGDLKSDTGSKQLVKALRKEGSRSGRSIQKPLARRILCKNERVDFREVLPSKQLSIINLRSRPLLLASAGLDGRGIPTISRSCRAGVWRPPQKGGWVTKEESAREDTEA